MRLYPAKVAYEIVVVISAPMFILARVVQVSRNVAPRHVNGTVRAAILQLKKNECIFQLQADVSNVKSDTSDCSEI